MTAANFAASTPDRTTARVRLRPTMASGLGAHRFWLDVKARNSRAKARYASRRGLGLELLA